MRGPKLGAIVAAALLISGCQTLAEEAIERGAEAADAGDVELDLDEDGGSVRVEGEDGSFEQQVGQLPSDFPSSVPLPPNFTVEFGQSIQADDGHGWSAFGTFDGNCQDFLQFLDGLGSSWSVAEGSSAPQCNTTDGHTSLTAHYEGSQYRLVYSFGVGEQNQVSMQVFENTP